VQRSLEHALLVEQAEANGRHLLLRGLKQLRIDVEHGAADCSRLKHNNFIVSMCICTCAD
jgi:hypothetical protein